MVQKIADRLIAYLKKGKKNINDSIAVLELYFFIFLTNESTSKRCISFYRYEWKRTHFQISRYLGYGWPTP